ncbi:MAG: RNA polymerase sigma factor [Actinomycetota bacterium]|nr:RNA polymerase sigma factor [Actinomycetota bacterium]
MTAPTLDVEAAYRTGRTAAVRRADRLTGDHHAAQDIVQVAYLRLWTWRNDWEDRGRGPSAFINTAVGNLAIDRWRSSAVARTELVADPGPQCDVARFGPGWPTPVALPSPERAGVSSDIGRAVRAAMRDLTEKQRTAVFLRYWLDLSGAEIAERMGVDSAAVKGFIFRGLRSLGRALADWSTAVTS